MWIPNNRFMRESGVADSTEAALTYLEATAGQSEDAPGTSEAKRRAYVEQGPEMVDFLVDKGVKLKRVSRWPDYYDERPGGSVPGRTVIAEIFNVNELPKQWRSRLRPNFMKIAAYHEEGFNIALMKSSWRGKATMLKVGLRVALAKLTGKSLTPAGGALQGRMLKASLAAGVDIRVNCAVKSFLSAGDRVAGVVADCDGQEKRIGAKLGVLVNAGGFAQNQAMRDQYIPHTSTQWTATAPGDTGEMIQELIAMGAAFGQMNERVGNQMSIPPGCENLDGQGVDLGNVAGQMNLSKPGAILVDQTGQRYMNECGSYMEFCQNILKRHESVPAIPSWYVFDSTHINNYMLSGTMPGPDKPQAWYDNGYLHKADSIEALASQINIDPSALSATVERFNAGAREGRDDEFHRGDRAYDNWLGDHYREPSNTLSPLDSGPFYAIPMLPGDVGTYGGVVVDEFARVLREDGTPMAGLYATGTTTASIMGRYYPGAGSSIGPSFVYGYIAAKHAAGLF